MGNNIQHPKHSAHPQSSFRTIICVLVGLSIGFNLEMIGRITGSELIFLAILPVLIVTRSIPPLVWPIHRLLLLAVVWFLAQLVSDIVNDSNLGNMARGAARALITGGLFLGYYSLGLDNRQRVIILFVANAIGLSIGYFYDPGELALNDPWKFGYGRTVTMLVIAAAGLLWSARLPLLAVSLCLLISMINLILGFRSMAGIVFMVAISIALAPFLERFFQNSSKIKIVIVMAAITVGSISIINIYEYAAISDLIGDENKYKYIDQQGSYGLILSGRSELFISSQAIFDSIIFGHGTWATSDYYYDLFMEQLGYGSLTALPDTPNPIPTHSYLFGAWTEGGIFSALIWFYVLSLLVRVSLKLLRQPELVHPVILFCLFELSWNIIFSPYGLDGRVNACFEIIALVMVLHAQSPRTTPAGFARPLHPMPGPTPGMTTAQR